MQYIIIRTLGVLITSYITKVGVPIVFAWTTGWTALMVAFVLAIINGTIKPIISILSIPINIVTLGLFSFVVNGLMILLAGEVVHGFHIPSLVLAIWFAFVLSIINWILHIFE